MRFTKIKVNEKAVTLAWTTKKGDGESITSELSSPQRPMEALPAALSAFRPFVLGLLGLPTEWLNEMVITTLSLNEDEDNRRGLIVTAIRKIPQASGRPVVFNTPHMRERLEGDTGTTGFLDPVETDLIAEAEKAATAYVQGERVQAELFPPKKDALTGAAVAPAGAAEEGGKKGVSPAAGKPASRHKDKRRQAPRREGEQLGELANEPGAPPTDDEVRALLLEAGRDVPVDAIAIWTSAERDAAIRWGNSSLAQRRGTRNVPAEELEEPEPVKRYATLPLGVDAASEAAPSSAGGDTGSAPAGDGWTDPNPPRLTDETEVDVLRAAARGD